MSDSRTCPECGSERIEQDMRSVLSYIGGERKYRCRECGYKGIIALEAGEGELEEFQNALEQEDLDPDSEEPVKSYSGWKKIGIGFVIFLLGLGSIPRAFESIEGVIGSFLIFIGMGVMYRGWIGDNRPSKF